MADAVAVLDVVRDAERLVADVALRDRVRLVAAHGDDTAVLHVDPQAAVVAAEHAYGGEVRSVLHHAFSSRVRYAGPGRAVMSRAVTGWPQCSQARRNVVTCPHPRWMRSIGGPFFGRMWASPQPAIVTMTP